MRSDSTILIVLQFPRFLAQAHSSSGDQQRSQRKHLALEHPVYLGEGETRRAGEQRAWK